jgi:hypothetical protein
MVDIDRSRLDDAPRYANDRQPAYDETYGRSVNGYWGVPFAAI